MCLHVSELGYTSDARGAMHWAQTKKKGQVRRAPKWHEIPRPRLSPKAGSEGESPPECSAFGASLPLWQRHMAGIGASRSLSKTPKWDLRRSRISHAIFSQKATTAWSEDSGEID